MTGADEKAAPAAPQVLLAVRDLRFGYGEGRPAVLDGASLEVAAGQCVCLMGRNGCGKSTLLDCVLGSLRPAAGAVEVLGEPAARLRPAELARRVAYVPQVHERGFPYPVEHVVLMGRTAHMGALGAPGADDRAAVERALEDCGIAHLAKRPYTGLSGGEMQMVMLARALVQQTPLVLMDEPTAHLDFRNELVFLERVEELVRDRGVAVLMATHAPNQAFHLERAGVDVRVALMAGGRVVRQGAPGDALRPRDVERVFGVRAAVLEGAVAGGAGARVQVRQAVPLSTVREVCR